MRASLVVPMILAAVAAGCQQQTTNSEVRGQTVVLPGQISFVNALWEPDAPKPTVLNTQQFERGELTLQQPISAELERFLDDLCTRYEYDLSQHEGQPGPDHAYLEGWIVKVCKELIRRGYRIDEDDRMVPPTRAMA